MADSRPVALIKELEKASGDPLGVFMLYRWLLGGGSKRTRVALAYVRTMWVITTAGGILMWLVTHGR